MAEDDTVWVYEPNVPLAIISSIVYGLLFIGITYLTFIKYRAWWFSVVVVGSAIEVAGYVLRVYSAKNQSELVRPCPCFHLHRKRRTLMVFGRLHLS